MPIWCVLFLFPTPILLVKQDCFSKGTCCPVSSWGEGKDKTANLHLSSPVLLEMAFKGMKPRKGLNVREDHKRNKKVPKLRKERSWGS